MITFQLQKWKALFQGFTHKRLGLLLLTSAVFLFVPPTNETKACGGGKKNPPPNLNEKIIVPVSVSFGPAPPPDDENQDCYMTPFKWWGNYGYTINIRCTVKFTVVGRANGAIMITLIGNDGVTDIGAYLVKVYKNQNYDISIELLEPCERDYCPTDVHCPKSLGRSKWTGARLNVDKNLTLVNMFADLYETPVCCD